MSFTFNRIWSVRLPIVIRQMHHEYVEAFFSDGSLRLSSFDSFRKHPDEARRDGEEGFVAMEITEPNGQFTALGANAQEAYVLCASTIEPIHPSESTTHSYFRIIDTLAFADAVARQIPGFLGGVEGPCLYREEKIVRKSGTRPIAPPTNDIEAEAWFKEQQEYVGKHAIDGYFLKHLRFSHEAEYRFIWFAEGSKKEFIDIKCPAAIQFCERM